MEETKKSLGRRIGAKIWLAFVVCWLGGAYLNGIAILTGIKTMPKNKHFYKWDSVFIVTLVSLSIIFNIYYYVKRKKLMKETDELREFIKRRTS